MLLRAEIVEVKRNVGRTSLPDIAPVDKGPSETVADSVLTRFCRERSHVFRAAGVEFDEQGFVTRKLPIVNTSRDPLGGIS